MNSADRISTGGVAPLAPLAGDAPLDPLAGDAPLEPLAGDPPLEPLAGDPPRPLKPPTLGDPGRVQVEKLLLACILYLMGAML